MLLMNKLTLSTSSFTVSNNNKRKRTPSMASLTPLLQRIKRSFLQTKLPITNTDQKKSNAARRSNTVHCCLSEKQDFDDKESVLFCTEDTKYYALRLERSIHENKYVQPAENWWATSPPIQSNQDSRSVMIC
ncbi:hypothetical protein INT47_009215 [Mucor saturninus]|uniref:Uncharacterized protein n=1 Tax=Mucor saturninus TaxID=64648 RepID=A0A8H7RPM7_9FUNG|nr:hypothetical protein INT47_009215 [Mucor saturninus]